jgi:hypothetical protein
MKTNALWFATIIFLLITIAHIVRYLKKWTIVVADFNVPVEWSLYAAIVIGLITIWMWVAAKK